MEKIAIYILALLNIVCCKGDKTEFEKPIMYGVTIGFIIMGVVTIGFIYSLNYERDPLVYSKFLSVRKNKWIFKFIYVFFEKKAKKVLKNMFF